MSLSLLVGLQMKNISASEDQLEPEGLAELSPKVRVALNPHVSHALLPKVLILVGCMVNHVEVAWTERVPASRLLWFARAWQGLARA